MTAPLVIANARIVDPAGNTDRKGALLVADGRIEGLAEGAPQGVPDGATLVDARGLIVAPGLIDMRVFTGEPGHEYRETLATAADALTATTQQDAWQRAELQRLLADVLDEATTDDDATPTTSTKTALAT